MAPREAWAVLVIGLAALGAAFAPSAAADPLCDAAVPATRTATVQNDAYSGQDAGDEAAAALALDGVGRHYAFLDPVVRDGADTQDWYLVELPASGDRMLFNVTTEVADVSFRLDVFPPDANEPLSVWSDGTTLALSDAPAGQWLLRASFPGAHAAPSGCESAPAAPVSGVNAAVPVSNHGIYVGCDPVCSWT